MGLTILLIGFAAVNLKLACWFYFVKCIRIWVKIVIGFGVHGKGSITKRGREGGIEVGF
jgi:hypothetical protein